MKQLILAAIAFAISVPQCTAATIYIMGGGGAVIEGGKTTYCPDPVNAICAEITTSSQVLEINDVVTVTQGGIVHEHRIADMQSAVHWEGDTGEIEGADISFEAAD